MTLAQSAPGPGGTSTTAPRTSRSSTADVRQNMLELLRQRPPRTSLEAPLYTDPAMFSLDIEGIFTTQWLFATTEAEIPDPGDYVTVDFGPVSLIIVRGDDGQINAMHNVCRHRGARVLTDRHGSTARLTCAYHSWTYATDGTLIHASSPGETFDRTCFALRRVHTRSVCGLIFVCAAAEPPTDIDDLEDTVKPYLAGFDIASAKVATRIDLMEEGNWKLTMENNRECYHCGGHPELACSLFATWGLTEDTVPPELSADWDRSLVADATLQQRCDRYGLPWQIVEHLTDRDVGYRISREALDKAGESFSVTGQRLSQKLMGDLPDFRLGRTSLHVQPNAWFHGLSDHVITFAAFPVSAERTLVRTTWLVAEDAVAGEDYDVDELTYVWRHTNAQDADFVQLAQQGVSSPGYVPGPYMRSEDQVEAFVTWYTAHMVDHLAGAESRRQS
ncbi:aromatic ring-hydroxylating oxygenase subunit alpha [Corynebacterium provencense]|uniref:aromatic ring-hydroxylating oxygenase subunit alpha n=1 Tax=Corynebacterium provencense TaxID=1737425 RepID=UPI00082E10F7|nr:aromatic ring-hydroxylating dioxygenase subunit alpha [Corynebacterium provencense]MCI1256279.1 aromatic ring-hydroxylating dioxygenase subunit alpha [Corynebacterium provencense]